MGEKLQQSKDCPMNLCKNKRSSAPTGLTHRPVREEMTVEKILHALIHPYLRSPQIQ